MRRGFSISTRKPRWLVHARERAREPPDRLRTHLAHETEQLVQLLKDSQYQFRYLMANTSQAPVGLLMPPHTMTWRMQELEPLWQRGLRYGMS